MRGSPRRPGAGALVAAASVVVLVVLAVLGSQGPDDSDPSSRSAGKQGTLALYTWLGEGLGLDVHRISGRFDLSGTDLLVVAEPTTAFSDSDVAALTSHLRGGGDLLLAASTPATAEGVFEALDLRPEGSQPPGDATGLEPLDAAASPLRVPMGPALRFGEQPAATPVLGAGGAVVGEAVTVGGGHALVLGSGFPLTNLGLEPSRGDAYRLVLDVVERARGGRVAFDEVHHGEGASQGAGAIFLGPIGLAGGLAVLLFAGAVGLAGRRVGRAGAPAPESVPTMLGHIRAVAQLLERSRRRAGVAQRYADELKSRVGAAAGVDARLHDDAFIAALRGVEAARAEPVSAALTTARRLAAGRPRDAEVLSLALLVDDAERAWTAGAVAPT